MTDLAAFLTARLDEEERVAKLAAEIMALRPTSAPFGFRLLADIDAKRRIVDLHKPRRGWFAYPDPEAADLVCDVCCHITNQSTNEAIGEFPCNTLRLLALPYADHPDYDESWRP